MFQFFGNGRELRDVPNLMDVLGAKVEATRGAVFVLPDELAGAAAAIRRCYPGAALIAATARPGAAPILGLSIAAPAVKAGTNCKAPPKGPGLRARYFEGSSREGPPVLARIEDWPVRFSLDAQQFGSVEWSGYLGITTPGTYGFKLLGEPEMAETTLGSLHLIGDEFAAAELSPGRYPLNIRCRAKASSSSCWLLWVPPGASLQAIPTQFLLPAQPVGE